MYNSSMHRKKARLRHLSRKERTQKKKERIEKKREKKRIKNVNPNSGLMAFIRALKALKTEENKEADDGHEDIRSNS